MPGDTLFIKITAEGRKNNVTNVENRDKIRIKNINNV